MGHTVTDSMGTHMYWFTLSLIEIEREDLLVYSHTHTHTYIHTHIHTYIHTLISACTEIEFLPFGDRTKRLL